MQDLFSPRWHPLQPDIRAHILSPSDHRLASEDRDASCVADEAVEEGGAKIAELDEVVPLAAWSKRHHAVAGPRVMQCIRALGGDVADGLTLVLNPMPVG